MTETNRDINWVKHEIKCAEKLYEKIQSDDIDPIFKDLPDPWTYLDSGELWKLQWKQFVNESVDNLDTKYPGDKQKFLDYNFAMELFKHNPKNNPYPAKPTYHEQFKKDLKVIRALFDCREMRYMQMLSTIFNVISNEFPELLEDTQVPVTEEPIVKTI